jgi:undecaprenyl-diphosphatase
MTIIQVFVLGIVQGLTEFIPISSSAHLVLVPYILKWTFPKEQVFPFDVLVQVGTLVAVIAFFWPDLIKIVREWVKTLINRRPFASVDSRMGWYLILATIPAGVIGLLIKSYVEEAFQSPVATALFLLLTAALLFGCEFLGNREREFNSINWKDALIIGLFQVLSIFPGVSRSGSTITGGSIRHLSRVTAARFSFLMSIPVMLAAGLLSIFDLAGIPNLAGFIPVLLIGFITSMIVGYLSIRWLLSYISHHSFHIFAWYCVGLSVISLLIAYVR